MGQTMYLEALRHLSPSDPLLEPVREAIGNAIGYTPPIEKPGNDPSLMEVSGVVVRVGYWKAFNPLHFWFINRAQEGHDDDRPAFISPEQLLELEEILDQVEDDPDSAGEHFVDVEEVHLDPVEVDYTLRVIIHARRFQALGWDIYYRSDW